MKYRDTIMRRMATALVAGAVTASALAADFREHRGVYITPYVQDWPTSGLTTTNATIQQRNMRRALDRLQANGVNVIYFAVRPLCDAAYRSQYEPWSQCVSSRRGVEPPFDPLGFLVEEAHARGIEVYTWLNAYRYCTVYKHGESPLDYELTHPEWLLVQPHETILNPCLEEVKQRVCDVAADIVDHYDIDGFLFDDYYYTNGMPMSLDESFYLADKEAGIAAATQLQWRIDNVSSLIKRVHDVVKSHKPWVVYGIKPAGVASPPNIREYGLEPSPDIREKDWQYEGVAADPIYWYSQHYCDFMAPQIYWCDLFDPLQDWWSVASRKFDRHLYSAVSMSKYSDFGGPEFAREVEYARTTQSDNISGLGFFRFYYYMNEGTRVDGKWTDFPEYMGLTAFATKALHPVRPWNNVYAPAEVTDLRREGNTLTWDEVEGMRYTIYAFAPGEELRPYNTNLQQVRYTNSYDIPESMADLTYGVAVYDRYGNEYGMTTEGASRGEAVNPVLTYPAAGGEACDLFDFSWEPTGCENVLEVAETPDFEPCLVKTATAESHFSSFALNNIEPGKTYYWRVRTLGVNAPMGISETRSFTCGRIAVTGPTGNDAPTTPLITWTAAAEGTVYHVEIARDSSFKLMAYTGETTETSLELPERSLYSGYRYYVRVRAVRGNYYSQSDVATFWTADNIPASPTFVNPATAGATVHANESIVIETAEGTSLAVIQICDNEAFTGGVYRRTLAFGETATPELETIRIKGKGLTDGTTYYVRAVSRYFTQDNIESDKETPGVVTSFVYSATQGISDVMADGNEVSISPEGQLSMPVCGNRVEVCRADGSIACMVTCAGMSVDLSELTAGLYIVRVSGPSPAAIKWIKK